MKITSIIQSVRNTWRDWRGFKDRTGSWPILSIVASLLLSIVELGIVAVVVWVAVKNRWSEARMFWFALPFLLAFVVVWDRVKKAIRIHELQEYRHSKRRRLP